MLKRLPTNAVLHPMEAVTSLWQLAGFAILCVLDKTFIGIQNRPNLAPMKSFSSVSSEGIHEDACS